MGQAHTTSAMNHVLDALGGRKPGWPNLLSIVGLPDRIGPHDSRSSVSSFFENAGEGAYTSALLDHKVSGQDKMSRQVAAIKRLVSSITIKSASFSAFSYREIFSMQHGTWSDGSLIGASTPKSAQPAPRHSDRFLHRPVVLPASQEAE